MDVDSDGCDLHCEKLGWLGAWNQRHANAKQLQESWKGRMQSPWRVDGRQDATVHPTPPAANVDEPHPQVQKAIWPKEACWCAPNPPGVREASG